MDTLKRMQAMFYMFFVAIKVLVHDIVEKFHSQTSTLNLGIWFGTLIELICCINGKKKERKKY